MITVIITAYKEAKTITKTIEAVYKGDIKDPYEVIVVAPDEETLNAALEYGKRIPIDLRTIKDQKKGKPAALNLALKEAKGEILVFTDGDVYTSVGAINKLISHLKPNSVITGHPVTTNSVDNMLGWWGMVLYDVVHKIRLESIEKQKLLLISGYLWAIHKSSLEGFTYPEDLVTEDEYLSYYCHNKGIKTLYQPDATVNVKYPTTINDWLKQKVRTLGGSYQVKKLFEKTGEIRSFSTEVGGGFKKIFNYPKNIKQWFWLTNLLVARLMAWGKAFVDIRILKRGSSTIWKRIETTK